MKIQPTLATPRLRLRPFAPEDAPRLQQLAGDRAIADTTVSVPHPYEDGLAERWIQEQLEAFQQDRAIAYALHLPEAPELIGCISLRDRDPVHQHAEIGAWIGVAWWGRGFALEATVALVDYGFRHWGLNRIRAGHFVRNPASGRVLERAGFRREGVLREHVCKWGVFEDVVLLGRLRREWAQTPG
ncbi:MAG: GNAT family N-acetyltransferase [Verrucomicrobia bacterium]|nr:GNAT family N-acetyltransferase [Verrucomicrobiota bacterium]